MNGTASTNDDVVSVGRELPRLAAATIIDGRRVRVTWRNGDSVAVDLAPVLLSHRHFIPLRRDDELFETFRINEDGTALAWDGGVELSAIWISDLPRIGMENDEFRHIMEDLHLSLEGMAHQLEISRRQIAQYRGARPIPNHIAFAARHLVELAKRGRD